MDILKFININDKTDVQDLILALESGKDIQLSFDSLITFETNFSRISNILYNYADQIKSLYCPVQGSIFEDTVKILSQLEDCLELPIGHITIESKFYEDIKQLVNFYHDDLQDGSLDLSIYCDCWTSDHDLHGPIDTIAYIERNNLQGVSICLNTITFNESSMDAAFKYTSIIYIQDEEFFNEPYNKLYFEYRYSKWFVEVY